MILISLMVLAQSPVHAEFFQCTDENGKTIFKDSVCEADEVMEKKIDPVALENRSNIFVPHVDDSSPLGKNLLKNASFESKLIDWKVPLGALWTNNQGNNRSGGLIIQSEKPPEDKYIHETIVEQCVLLGPGSSFELSADFRLEKVAFGQQAEKQKYSNRVNVIWYESSDCTTGGQYGHYIQPKNVAGWQTLTRKNITPALHAKAAKITIVQNARTYNGLKSFWDNINFSASEVFQQSGRGNDKANRKYTLAPGANHLKNGKFKSNLSSWRTGLETKWTSTGNKSAGSARTKAHSEKGGMGAGAFSQCVNFGTNKKFELGASVKKDTASTQDGGGRIRVSWNDKENCYGRSKTDNKSADIADISGWQQLQVTDLIAPDDTQSVLIEIIQSVKGPGSFFAFWDDIYFAATERFSATKN